MGAAAAAAAAAAGEVAAGGHEGASTPPTPDDVDRRGQLRGLGEQLMRMDADNHRTLFAPMAHPGSLEGFRSAWISVLEPFLRTVDPDLDSVLKPYRDATLLETHGERFLELVVTKAPCAEWLNWFSTSLRVAACADNIDVFQRLFALCVHDAEFWACTRPALLLTTAGMNGSVEVLSFLLNFDVFITATQEVCERIGTPALVMAAVGGHRSCVSALIKTGAYLEQASCNFETPLKGAVRNGHEGIVLDLLAAGADVNNAKGHRPTAVEDGPGVIYYTPLCDAALANNERMVDILLAAGAGFGGNPQPVVVAAREGFCGVLERLLLAGADANVVSFGCRDQSALERACSNGHEGAVELLLRHNARVAWRCDRDVVSRGVLLNRSIRGRLDHPSTLDAAETSAADRIHGMLRRARAWDRRGWLVMMRARRLVAAQFVDDSSFATPSPVEQPPARHGDGTQDDAEGGGRAAVESSSLADAPTAGSPGGGDDGEERTTTIVSTEPLLVSDGGHDEAKQPGAGGGWECAVEWVLQCPDEGGVVRQILGFL